jgi:2-C-methyl-D-erythritol 2,4-cyclodiphosphate synthase
MGAATIMSHPRIGVGYDVHRLVKGRKLILGGVEITSDIGLDGHSDADVLLHAVMDAILGAAGKGDIGQHFPNTDATYKDVSSLELLRRVMAMIRADGYRVGNIDVALIAEAPKIGPYVNDMRACIADVLQVPSDAIGIKATTNEQLGWIGRGEGMAAHAVALLVSS